MMNFDIQENTEFIFYLIFVIAVIFLFIYNIAKKKKPFLEAFMEMLKDISSNPTAIASVASVFCIYLFFSCFNSNGSDSGQDKEDTSVSSLTTTIATQTTTEVVDFGSANIVNGGYVWYDGMEYRTSNNIYSSNIVDEQLYYEDSNEHHIYCCNKKDFSDNKLIYDEARVDELTYYGGWFYFRRSLGDDVSICKMRIDGSDVRVLVRSNEWYMNIYQDKIYFVNFDEGYALQSMNLDGNQLTTLATNASDICVANNTIFFSDRETRYLYKMNLDGTGLMQLNHTYTRCTNYYQGKLYYFGDGNHMIYRCDLMGNIEKSYEDGANFLVLAGGYIYAYMDDSQIRKIACD